MPSYGSHQNDFRNSEWLPKFGIRTALFSWPVEEKMPLNFFTMKNKEISLDFGCVYTAKQSDPERYSAIQ